MNDSGRRSADAQAMLEAVVAISSQLDLHSVLETIVQTCCSVTRARYAFLGVLSEDGGLIDHVAHGLADDEVKRILERPMGVNLLGHLLRHPDPVRLSAVGPDHELRTLAERQDLHSFLGVPLRIGEANVGALFLAEKPDRESFTRRDESMVDGLARVAGVAIDNARAYALSERRREWVEATGQMVEKLHPPFHVEDTLHQIALGVRRVARASLAAVVHGRDGGYDVPSADGPGFPAIAGIIDEASGEIAFAQETGEIVIAPYGESDVLVCAPLDRDLSYPGVLLLILDRAHGELLRADRDLLATYAAQASLALDRATALTARQQMVLMADRDRIARDLHDLVIQRLFATGLHLQGTRRVASLEDMYARLDTAVADLDQTIRDIRTTIFELEHGHEDNLRTGLTALVREYEPLLGFAPTLRTTGAVESLVERDLAEQVLATLREALSNVAKHARATHCTVELHVDPDELMLIVTDNGRGCCGDGHESGLRNLRRRAEDRRGRMVVEPAHPRGTRLEWRVATSP